MIFPPRLWFSCILVLAFSSAAFGQFGIPVGHYDSKDKPVAARDRVSQYCRLDYGGARLGGDDWTKLHPLVTWPHNPDYPLINVISRYDVEQNVATERGHYIVTVHYRLLGRFNLGQGYTKEVAGNVEDVQFTVEETNGELKIADSNPNYPRPSRAAMLKWLQDQQAKAQDAHEKVVYDNALQQLQGQSGSPFSK